MHPQLQAIADDLESASQRLRTLHSVMPRDGWNHRPAAGRWSPAECVAHLNLTSDALLPRLRSALQEAREKRHPAPRRYRRNVLGWVIWMGLAPSLKLKTKTIAAFAPSEADVSGDLAADFARRQAELIACVRSADGLPIDSVRLVSPFGARVTYNVYAALTLVSRHQHRHLQQAERAVRMFAPQVLPLPVHRRTAIP